MRTNQNKLQMVDEIDTGTYQPKYVQQMMGPYGLVSVGDTVTVHFHYEGFRGANRTITAKVLSIIIGPDTHWIYVKDVSNGDTYYPMIQHVWRVE